jgi:hypothetical protein
LAHFVLKFSIFESCPPRFGCGELAELLKLEKRWEEKVMFPKCAFCSAVVLALLMGACAPSASPANLPQTVAPATADSSLGPLTSPPPASTVPPAGIGQRTKTSNCVGQNGLSDPACTPGAIFSGATRGQVCTSGYSSQVRNVPQSEKDQVYAEYGIASHSPGQYEVDHLVSLELGGSNDIANLWPEPAEPRPGFHEKDQVENYLHAQVCSGAMSMQEAQIEIATNWRQVYQSMPHK